MNILGFNPSHHGSVCLLQDGEIKYFIQEERVGNRDKYVPLPFRSFIDILQNYRIDFVTWASPSMEFPLSNKDSVPYWAEIAWKYYPKSLSKDYSSSHHVSHCSHAFYNSGFKHCIGIVIDGLGSAVEDLGQETETIFECSYPANFKTLSKKVFSLHSPIPELFTQAFNKLKINLTNNITLSRIYETITMHLGWSRNEAGKIMGLAPYGKFNPNFPSFFDKNTGNPNVFYTNTGEKRNDKYNETFIDENKNPQLKLQKNPEEWHHNQSKITDLEKDLAWKVQNDTQRVVGDYIENAIQETGLKQVCCSGGYFLNCVANYYLTKRFPNVEFYFEPIANDAGTAIGAAKLLWHNLTQDTTIRPFKSLYLGKQYSKDELLKGIKKYKE